MIFNHKLEEKKYENEIEELKKEYEKQVKKRQKSINNILNKRDSLEQKYY